MILDTLLIYLIFVRVVLVSCCSVYGARLGCIKSVRLNWRPWNRHVPVQCAVHAWGVLIFHVLFGSTSWSNHAYFMHTHRYMILSLFTYFRGVGMKRPFRPTTFRDHLSKSSFLFSFFKNCSTITSANVSSQGWRELAVQASCCC